eukprot:Lankesteria_metandrocarpae@DN5227_c0_g1_i1.p2
MASVDQWVDICSSELEGKDNLVETLSAIDTFLTSRTYLGSECITVADLCVCASIANRCEPADVQSLKHLQRWFNTLVNQKLVKRVLGEAKLVKAAPSAAKKADEAMDADAPAPPARCPLDDLPPSSFNLDAWKRCYSNTKDLYGEAMKYFWENYDSAGWSLWYMRYEKLEDECKVSFVTSNQLGGFLQRTDPNFRKYAFGNCNVIGKGSDFNITGLWLMRGTEMAPQMKDHPSYEYHTWRKLSHTNEVDKKLVADYWCAEDEVEGQPIVDAKVYK